MEPRLAITTSADALVAGTFMKNERFNKKDDQQIVLVDNGKKGELRPVHWLEVLQLSFVYPGPTLVLVWLLRRKDMGNASMNSFM